MPGVAQHFENLPGDVGVHAVLAVLAQHFLVVEKILVDAFEFLPREFHQRFGGGYVALELESEFVQPVFQHLQPVALFLWQIHAIAAVVPEYGCEIHGIFTTDAGMGIGDSFHGLVHIAAEAGVHEPGFQALYGLGGDITHLFRRAGFLDDAHAVGRG